VILYVAIKELCRPSLALNPNMIVHEGRQQIRDAIRLARFGTLLGRVCAKFHLCQRGGGLRPRLTWCQRFGCTQHQTALGNATSANARSVFNNPRAGARRRHPDTEAGKFRVKERGVFCNLRQVV